MQGYSVSYDYTHMYRVKDLNGPLPIPKINENSVLGFLMKKNLARDFVQLLARSDLSGIYNDGQASMTIFVPIEMDTCYINELDQFQARQLILYHTLEKPLCYDFITSSKGMLLNTKIPGSTLFVENIDGDTYINRQVKLLGSHQWGNSVICFISDMLFIDNNPLGNVDI